MVTEEWIGKKLVDIAPGLKIGQLYEFDIECPNIKDSKSTEIKVLDNMKLAFKGKVYDVYDREKAKEVNNWNTVLETTGWVSTISVSFESFF